MNFIESLSKEHQQYFRQTIHLNQGTEILNENDQCNHVLFLIKGEIEVYKISKNGKTFRLYTISPGESCVLNLSCVLSGSHYMAYARATNDIDCILIPYAQFLKMFHEEEGLRDYVFQLISTRLIQITSKVEGIVLESLEDRLIEWLKDQGSKNIYITHSELANHLGSVREVISRYLKKWEKEGKVKLFRGRIEIIDL